MHSLTYVIVPKEVVYGNGFKKDLGIRNDKAVIEYIEKVMLPYNEETVVAPIKHYLSAKEIISIKEYYKIKTDSGVLKRLEEWRGNRGAKDKKGIYELCTHNPKAFWDYYIIGGAGLV